MKIGVSTWPGDNIVVKNLEKLYSLGLKFVEVSLDYPLPYRDVRGLLEKLKKFKRELGIEVGFHLPWRDISLSSPIPVIRRGSLEAIEKCISLTLNFEPSYYNLHLNTLENLSFENVWSEVLNASYEALVELSEYLGDKSLLTVENNDGRVFHNPDHFEYLASVFEDLKFCFDVGHAILAAGRNKSSKKIRFDNVVLKWSKALPRERVVLLHLHGVVYSEESKKLIDHTLLSKTPQLIDYTVKTFNLHKVEYLNLEVFRKPSGEEKLDLKDIVEQVKIVNERFKS